MKNMEIQELKKKLNLTTDGKGIKFTLKKYKYYKVEGYPFDSFSYYQLIKFNIDKDKIIKEINVWDR